MSALLIALSLTNQVATVRFTAPENGSYSVQRSVDALRWRVVASGPVRAGEHVVAREACGVGAIYRVEWRAVSGGGKQ